MNDNKKQEEAVIISQSSDSNIQGWLLFFLFSITVGGVFSFIYPIVTFKFQEYVFNYFLAGADLFFAFSLFSFSIYTLIAFWKRKPNAVFCGKAYIVLCLASNLFLLLIGNYEENGIGSFAQIVRSLIWTSIWYIYLCKSEQVKRHIPVGYRKVYKRDYCILYSIVFIYILCICLGIATQKQFIALHEKDMIEKKNLSENDYTDGTIIFTVPEGFRCHKRETENNINYHELEKNDSISISIVSDYDTKNTNQNFEYYWNNWRDMEMKEYENTVLASTKYTIYDSYCHFRSIRYETESPVIWDFALLFNERSGKVCLFSAWYFEGMQSHIDEILASVKFE